MTQTQTVSLSAVAIALAEMFAKETVLAEAPKIIAALETDIANENPLKLLKNEELKIALAIVTEVYTACGGTAANAPAEENKA